MSRAGSDELPPDWRKFSTAALRDLVRKFPDRPPYLLYQRKARLIEWLDQHVECPRCPTCGQPI